MTLKEVSPRYSSPHRFSVTPFEKASNGTSAMTHDGSYHPALPDRQSVTPFEKSVRESRYLWLNAHNHDARVPFTTLKGYLKILNDAGLIDGQPGYINPEELETLLEAGTLSIDTNGKVQLRTEDIIHIRDDRRPRADVENYAHDLGLDDVVESYRDKPFLDLRQALAKEVLNKKVAKLHRFPTIGQFLLTENRKKSPEEIQAYFTEVFREIEYQTYNFGLILRIILNKNAVPFNLKRIVSSAQSSVANALRKLDTASYLVLDEETLKQHVSVGRKTQELRNVITQESQALWSNNQSRLRLVADPSIDGTIIYADPAIKSIFANVLGNVLKYGGNTLKVAAMNCRGFTTVVMADNGRGMNPNRAHKV
ncbi:MAG: hypothetical protein AAB874_05100, partial [Patescibacteria group bacterium]